MATKRAVVSGEHRSIALALDHLRRLESENPLATVRIVSRRNSSGQFSSNGRQFTFEVVTQEEKPDLESFFDAYDDAVEYDEMEWESSADYHNEGA